MPKSGTGTTNILDGIREFLKELKELLETLKEKAGELTNKNKYVKVIKAVEALGDKVDELEKKGDVNQESLFHIQTVLAGINEKISTISPDEDLKKQIEAITKEYDEILEKAREASGKEFTIQGKNIMNYLYPDFSKRTDTDKEKLFASLPLIENAEGKLYLEISSKSGEKRYSEITVEGDKIILGEPQNLPNISYKKLNENVFEAVERKYKSPENQIQKLLSGKLSEKENLEQLVLFIDKYRNVQTYGNISAKYNAEENEFQIYDKRSQVLLTVKQEEGKMTITSYETDEPFVKKGTGTVIREFENKDGMISIKTNKAAIDKTIMRLLSHPVTNEFLAYYGINDKEIDNRFEKAAARSQEWLENHRTSLSNGKYVFSETEKFNKFIQEAASKDDVKLDICCGTGAIVMDFYTDKENKEDACIVEVAFTKRGIPSVVTVIQGDCKTHFIAGASGLVYGDIPRREKERNIFQLVRKVMNEAVNQYIKEGNTFTDVQAINGEAKAQSENGMAYSYITNFNALTSEPAAKDINTKNLNIAVMSDNIIRIEDKVQDSALTIMLDENGSVSQTMFSPISSQTPAIVDTDKQTSHTKEDFIEFGNDANIKFDIYRNLLAIAACLEYKHNKQNERTNEKGILGEKDSTSVGRIFSNALKKLNSADEQVRNKTTDLDNYNRAIEERI